MSTSTTELLRRHRLRRLAGLAFVALLVIAAAGAVVLREVGQPKTVSLDGVHAIVDGRHVWPQSELEVASVYPLILIRESCIGVDLGDSKGLRVLVWPHGTHLVSRSGEPTVRLPSGRSFEVGDTVKFGPGETRDLDLPDSCDGIKGLVIRNPVPSRPLRLGTAAPQGLS